MPAATTDAVAEPDAAAHVTVEADRDAEAGSLVTEYGLIVVVGATIASLVIKWASGGAIWELLAALTAKVRALVGA